MKVQRYNNCLSHAAIPLYTKESAAPSALNFRISFLNSQIAPQTAFIDLGIYQESIKMGLNKCMDIPCLPV